MKSQNRKKKKKRKVRIVAIIMGKHGFFPREGFVQSIKRRHRMAMRGNQGWRKDQTTEECRTAAAWSLVHFWPKC